MADVIEKFLKVSEEFDINPIYCVCLPGYTWQCGLKYSDIKLQTFQDEELILLLENNIQGCILSVMGDRYVVSDDIKKILYVDANYLYGWAMSQMLPHNEIEMSYGYPDVYIKN